MTAPASRPASPATRLDDVHPAASLCVTALTLVTVISLCRVFPDWDYLRPMLAVALAVHIAAVLLRYARSPLWIALPVLLLVVFWLISLVYYRDTLTLMMPTGRTIDLMRVDLRLVLDQFATAVAPVPSEGSFAAATATAVAFCAVLADTFAFRAYGRVEAIVPTGVLFVFTSALGTDRHRIAVAALWIGVALLTIAMLRFTQTGEDTTWMGSRRLTLAAALPAIALTVGCSAIAAGALAPRLPGAGEDALIDTRNRGGSVTEVLSPLVDIRARLKNRGNSELFTVRSSDGGHYWRVISLPEFDGNEWSPPEEDLLEMGDRSSEVPLSGLEVQQRFTIKAIRGHLVPAAFHPTQVSPDDIVWAPESQSLVLPDADLQRNDVIAVVSLVGAPTTDQLRAATVSSAPSEVYYELPSGLPGTARDAAEEVTAGATTPYDQALALQNWFRDSNNFTYDTDVQFGNSNDAIGAFLHDRRGFCQQFAGTFAVMARTLGLPARVAVGYTPGDYGNDGQFHVYGRHAHAWPEVWFDGIGWVAFEPTPGRGSTDTAGYTGVAAAQDDSRGTAGGGNPGSVTPVPSFAPGDPDATSTVPGQGGPGVGPGGSTTVPPTKLGGTNDGSSILPTLMFGTVVLLVLWILLAPRLVAMVTDKGGRTTRERVVGAWSHACYALSLAGAPPVGGSTPLEYADRAEVATGVDHIALHELAVHVTRAVYSSTGVNDHAAARSEALEAEVEEMCRTRTPITMRARAMVDPRLIRRRIAG